MMQIKSFAPLAATALALVGLVLPTIASAQGIPSYAQPVRDETIQGRIVSVNGTFNISVRDDRGFVDNVELHQGTIINPTGLTLEAGMSVTIVGVSNGGEFDANEIDTPYQYSGPVPEPVYLGPGWWYPGYGYGYGPSFGLALVFGGGGFFYEHRPFYGHPFAFNGHAFVPGRPGVVRAPLGSARAIQPVGRAPQGAWRSFSTARAGYAAPRGYAGGQARAYTAGGSRGYSGGASRSYGGASRGSARSTSTSHGGGGHAGH
jgi:hypothetical protein